MQHLLASDQSANARGLGILLVGVALIGAIWVVYLIRRNRQGEDVPVNPPGADDADFFHHLNEQEVHWPGDAEPIVVEAEVVAVSVQGWDGFDPFDILDQLRRAVDGDVTQRLLKWNSLAPLLADPSREVAPEFARLVSRVGTGALAIVGGEPGPTWDACMTGAHRLATCPQLVAAGVLWDVPRENEADDPALIVRHRVRFGEVTGW